MNICALWNYYIETTAITFTTALKTIDGITADIAERAGQGLFLIAEDDQGLLGFTTCFQFRGGPGYRFTKEHSIILDARSHGRGVGRALLERLCANAAQTGVHSMWAGVSGENPAGVAFHQKLGFQKIAVLPEVGHKFDRWMDLVLMQKIL